MKRYQQYKKYDHKQQVFSIRKLSYGTGSALLTTLLFLGATQSADAAETTDANAPEAVTETASDDTGEKAVVTEQPAIEEATADDNTDAVEPVTESQPTEEVTPESTTEVPTEETTPEKTEATEQPATEESATTEPTQTATNNKVTDKETTTKQQPELKNNVDDKISDVSINVKDNKIEDVVDYGEKKETYEKVQAFKEEYYKKHPDATRLEYKRDLKNWVNNTDYPEKGTPYDNPLFFEATRSNKGLKPSEYEVKAKVSDVKPGDYFTFQHDGLTDLNGNYADDVKVQLPSFYLESDSSIEVARAINFDNQTKKITYQLLDTIKNLSSFSMVYSGKDYVDRYKVIENGTQKLTHIIGNESLSYEANIKYEEILFVDLPSSAPTTWVPEIPD
ncbi:YSIRK-type signal peptide-containing protein [Staphylococcus rostri]